MPVFFSNDKLTQDQRDRYAWAISEYERIQDENAERFSLQGRAYQKGDCRHLDGTKSALFWRLLQGKAALPYPPPTAMSYPWYEVIEDDGPFEVGFSSLYAGKVMRNIMEPLRNTISINQTLWSIREKNEAAQRVEDLLDEARSLNEDQILNSPEGVFPLMPAELRQRILDALAAKPEWVVQFGDWPPYVFYYGRNTWGAHESVVNQGARFGQGWEFGDISGGNPKILGKRGPDKSGAYWYTVEVDGWQLRKIRVQS
jgi:hypothetical protein